MLSRGLTAAVKMRRRLLHARALSEFSHRQSIQTLHNSRVACRLRPESSTAPEKIGISTCPKKDSEMRKMNLSAGLASLAFALAPLSAHATVVFTDGNNPQQPGEENVLYGSSQTGSLITGVTNQSHTTVDFSSTTDTLVTTANGQANLTAQDGLINQVTISVPGSTFGDLIINPFLGTGNPTPT